MHLADICCQLMTDSAITVRLGEPGSQGKAVGGDLAQRGHREKLVMAFMGLTPLEKVPCSSGEPVIISDSWSEWAILS